MPGIVMRNCPHVWCPRNCPPELTAHFGIKTLVCVNKWDLNAELAERTEAEARRRGVEAVGRIRYDQAVTQAQIRRQSLVEYTEVGASQDVRVLWAAVSDRLDRLSPLAVL